MLAILMILAGIVWSIFAVSSILVHKDWMPCILLCSVIGVEIVIQIIVNDNTMESPGERIR